MPQMAPISWLVLFFVFSITLMIFNIKNYFCFSYNSNESSQNLNIKQHKMNWKW
uniref:ATP synthase complex subunit 8 n=1 Tax=Aedes alboannulatus TaxID=1806178 RepID=A0A7T0GED6_9DIPT|nr:ATP synthase F0 subunit 8 [Aedes alboannulatus]QPJ78555.1 ATP synthase F0 subunit 8 [Aedes alboannulatus]QPJ78568.1 ATP synthase F0 subunit 8 [Aedes alboannulatus]